MFSYKNAPIYREIQKYWKKEPIPFHMPGHKMGCFYSGSHEKYLFQFDVTELSETDDLHHPRACIQEAMELLRDAYHTKKSYFLVNGTTSGIHVSILSCCRSGDKILVSRDCHKSVFFGIVLADATPVFFHPEMNIRFSIPEKFHTEKVIQCIKDNRDAKCIVLTRPNYYGVCYNIEEIVACAKSYDVLVILDEAHGAHLNFSPLLPKSGVDLGVDICIQSAHKTLPALTQSSYLHILGDQVDCEKIEYYLSSLQTTSPSFLLLAYMDIAREIMVQEGSDRIRELITRIKRLKENLTTEGSFHILGGKDFPSSDYDDTRLVIHTFTAGFYAKTVEKILRDQYKIEVEMSDLCNIVCICTIGDEEHFYEKLFEALQGIIYNEKREEPRIYNEYFMKTLDSSISMRDAQCKVSQRVHVKNSVGRVSRTFVVPYPPGIPVVCPGEVYNVEVVEYLQSCLKHGMVVHGINECEQVEVLM
jgi:lysine decarboxylase